MGLLFDELTPEEKEELVVESANRVLLSRETERRKL
jgi:hypothetical protein